MAPAKAQDKGPIQVIDRMMKLLDVLAEHPEPLGLKQIGQYTGLHPSTVNRILWAMAGGRLVDRIDPGSYRLGMRLLELGNLVRSRISVRELALPVMRELRYRRCSFPDLDYYHPAPLCHPPVLLIMRSGYNNLTISIYDGTSLNALNDELQNAEGVRYVTGYPGGLYYEGQFALPRKE